MKKANCIVVAALSVMAFLPVQPMSAQEPERFPVISSGMTPVTGISTTEASIPTKAREFIEKNYPAVAIAGSHEEFPSQKIEVRLADGTEMEFDNKGKLIEIDAPDNSVLPLRVLKNVVPRETFRHLSQEGFVNEVESVTIDGYGYKIDIDDQAYDEIRYGNDGLFVAIYED